MQIGHYGIIQANDYGSLDKGGGDYSSDREQRISSSDI